MDKFLGSWHHGDDSFKFGHIRAICNLCVIYNAKGNFYHLLENNEYIFFGELKFLSLLFN